MSEQKSTECSLLKVAIIGAGFSGTAMAAELHRLANLPLEIYLIDKTGCFGKGAAYSTPYSYHLLNVRAKDMSAFEQEPMHFVDWLKNTNQESAYVEEDLPLTEQFVPRKLYGDYLQALLSTLKLKLLQAEVIDIVPEGKQATLVFNQTLNQTAPLTVDKVILAIGNGIPGTFPFTVSSNTSCIHNPWQYTALEKIDSHDPVLIVGTGLSMIDAVLTLHAQKHQGLIYAVSRHGLLPLPHTKKDEAISLDVSQLPQSLRELSKYLRQIVQLHLDAGGDWRSIIGVLRTRLPDLWSSATLADKKRFVRHVMPYWNIHRHRVHRQINELLTHLTEQKQLRILAGRIMSVENGLASIRLRHKKNLFPFPVEWLVNCMGPGANTLAAYRPLADALIKRGLAVVDPLNLGFNVTAACQMQDGTGTPSSLLYTIGPPTKGVFWEITAVPDIRKQTSRLAKTLLASL